MYCYLVIHGIYLAGSMVLLRDTDLCVRSSSVPPTVSNMDITDLPNSLTAGQEDIGGTSTSRRDLSAGNAQTSSMQSGTEDTIDARRRKYHHARRIPRHAMKTWGAPVNRQLIRLRLHQHNYFPKIESGYKQSVTAEYFDQLGEISWDQIQRDEWDKFVNYALRNKYYRPVGYKLMARKGKCTGLWIGDSARQEAQDYNAQVRALGNPVTLRSRVRLAPTATNVYEDPSPSEENQGSNEVFRIDQMNNVTTVGSRWTTVRNFRVPKIVKVGNGGLTFDQGTAKPTGNIAAWLETQYPDVQEVNFFDANHYVAVDVIDPVRMNVPQNMVQTIFKAPAQPQGQYAYPPAAMIQSITCQWQQEIEFRYDLFIEVWGTTYPYDKP